MRTRTFSGDSRFAASNAASLAWSVLAGALGLLLVFLGARTLTNAIVSGQPGVSLPSYVLAVALLAGGGLILFRYIALYAALLRARDYARLRTTMKLDLVQVFLLVVLAIVLFPVLWIVSMSLDPQGFSRPEGLVIVPPSATLDAYEKVLTQPSANPVSFLTLLRNSLLVAGGTSVLAVIVGTSAAYAFSRLQFPGRKVGMLVFVIVLMIPPGGTLAPLFVLLNTLHLRNTLWGLMIAFTSSALPFAIWNMKGFIDSLPYDLEEAAQIDGCTRFQGFIRVIVPIASPGIAVTALMGFLTGWSEFIMSWTFLTNPQTFTLPMVLRGMVGQYAAGTPWAQFAAMAILVSIPPVILFFMLQRYLVGGLSMGAVKG